MRYIISITIFLVTIFTTACAPGSFFNTDTVYDVNFADYANNYNNTEAKKLYAEIIADKIINKDELNTLRNILIGKRTQDIIEICGNPITGKQYRELEPPKNSTEDEKIRYWVQTDSASMGYELFYVYLNMHKEVISVHLK